MSVNSPRISWNLGQCMILGLLIAGVMAILLKNWMYIGVGLVFGAALHAILEQRNKQGKG